MAKDRIDRNELPDKLVETASSAEDPLRAMAEMIADFVMEAEVTQKIGAEPHERSDERSGYRKWAPRATLGYAAGHAEPEGAEAARRGYLHYPAGHRIRISSTNPLERLNREIRRRTRVVGFSRTAARVSS